MTYPQRDRRSSRLKGYDYSTPGAYFVTICTHERALLFGEVVDAEMQLNGAGRMVARWWAELGNKFQHVTPETYIVMPNHFHGIVIITDPVGAGVGADLCVGPYAGPPLPEIVQWFKTMTTNEYIREVKISGWPPFCGHLWQRNYYEHIVRDEASLNRIREYIEGNPARWAEDSENPDNVGAGPCAWGT